MVPLFLQFFFYSLGPKAVLRTNNEKKREREREGGKEAGKGGERAEERKEGREGRRDREKENLRLARACPRMSQGGLSVDPITSVSLSCRK